MPVHAGSVGPTLARKMRAVRLECELAYKPDSVFVWRFIYAANPDGPRAASSRPYLALLPVGFARPGRCRPSRGLLPHDFTLA